VALLLEFERSGLTMSAWRRSGRQGTAAFAEAERLSPKSSYIHFSARYNYKAI
jgi:hypothetical protein